MMFMDSGLRRNDGKFALTAFKQTRSGFAITL